MSQSTDAPGSGGRPDAPDGPRVSGSKRQIAAWGSWDWGSAAFNAVMTTFVFTVYLTSTAAFGGEDYVSGMLGGALAIAGLTIALLAPITGQRSDAGGRRKLWLGVNSLLVVVLTGLCFFVYPRAEFLLLAVVLLAAANVFMEFASVNYNAMLVQISTPATIGKVSGFGWSMGYFGGIVALAIVLFGFVSPGFFGVPTEEALNIRVVAVFSAAWFAVFAIPVMFAVPEIKPVRAERISFVASYKLLFRRIRSIYRSSPHTIFFLLASAVFRDGLAAVFTFGGVIAAGTFGFALQEVIIFAIAGNVVAALGSIAGGALDDRIGPKRVIVISLVGLLIAGLAIFALGNEEYTVVGFTWSGVLTFWVFGLLLCLFVGPAQASSRAFLARLAPEGEAGELFGLYATTGRAVSFLAPALFTAFIAVFGSQRYGILGIMVVLLAGLVVLLPVKPPSRTPPAAVPAG
ncbi:MFS transporter [Arthrobacter castelli]|uniref:MFS transporter n=1 Tax=Arthrobacter castelli TaxID=271431 RepID=UPI00040AAD8B|nr:MFS transporter [Arthrobacter castelli]